MRKKRSIQALVRSWAVLGLWCVGLSMGAMAQTANLDSLRTAIEQMPDDSNKVWATESLQKQLVAHNDYKEALLVSLAMLDLAKKVEAHRGYAYAEAHVAYCYYFLGDYKLALRWIKRARKSAEKWLKPFNVSTCYGNAGLVYQDMGEYDSALVYLIQCLNIRRDTKDSVHWAYSHYDIAELFNELGDYDKAIEHHAKALELRKLIPHLVDEYNVIEDSYTALAMTYHRDGNSEKAIELLHASLAINEEKADAKRKATTLRRLAEVSYDRENFRQAVDWLEESLVLDQSINDLENSAETHILLGKAWHKLGEQARALSHFQTAIEVASKLHSRPRIVEANKHMATVYASTRAFDKAYAHLQLSAEGKDVLLNDQKIKALKEMEVRYETARKEAEIQELNNQKELADAEAARRAAEARQTQTMFWAAVLGVVLLIGLVILVYRNARHTTRVNAELQKQKLEIEEKNDQISQSLVEKESLLKEIHHRVKNNLQVISSLLNLQSASLEDAAALDAIKEGQNRVKSIALIHQKLYQTEDLSRVDFQDYSEQLASFLSATFRMPGKSIHTEVEANGIQLDIDTAVPLGLIINELVTNAYKYAFKQQDQGTIHIALTSSKAGFRLCVSDNGSGLPADLDIAKSKSLGMKLVHILSRQLKGSVEWESDQGARFIVHFQETEVRKQHA